MLKKRVKVCASKDPSRFFEEEFRVDSGALCSFVPEDALERIGAQPAATRTLAMADGRQETRLLDFQIGGPRGAIPWPVVFAPQGPLCLLGAMALENFGVEADPLNKRLKPILAVIGGIVGWA
ncbi:MAG TPA: hypothetical protein P5137_06405 [Candidatus Brocadiia bacterium]|nr:hypothetical protein [Candidatus Brocadiia bacterium]